MVPAHGRGRSGSGRLRRARPLPELVRANHRGDGHEPIGYTDDGCQQIAPEVSAGRPTMMRSTIVSIWGTSALSPGCGRRICVEEQRGDEPDPPHERESDERPESGSHAGSTERLGANTMMTAITRSATITR